MLDQVAYWNGASGDRWVREQEGLDRMLSPFGQAALDAAALRPGEAALDVGCGCGDTSLELARRIGPAGRVLGLDVSSPMLERARARAEGQHNVRLVLGDAGALAPDEGPFDLIFSRFGVMFFPDPGSAFTRLRAALRSPGRVAFVCWRQLHDNPWAFLPLQAAATVLGAVDAPAPGEPGPFSLADPERVRTILESAGFREVAIAPFDATMALAEGGDPTETAAAAARLGPVARLLLDRHQDEVQAAIEAIRGALAASADAEGRVHLRASAWVVTAQGA